MKLRASKIFFNKFSSIKFPKNLKGDQEWSPNNQILTTLDFLCDGGEGCYLLSGGGGGGGRGAKMKRIESQYPFRSRRQFCPFAIPSPHSCLF